MREGEGPARVAQIFGLLRMAAARKGWGAVSERDVDLCVPAYAHATSSPPSWSRSALCALAQRRDRARSANPARHQLPRFSEHVRRNTHTSQSKETRHAHIAQAGGRGGEVDGLVGGLIGAARRVLSRDHGTSAAFRG